MLEWFVTIKSLYSRLKKYNPITFFFGGFTWDSVTLKRIDQFIDNFILLIYLILLGAAITLVTMVDNGRVRQRWLLKYQGYYPLALQFLLGGLFSAYVVFYFKSASFTRTAIFLGLLVCLLIANEFLEKRLTNIHLLFSLYFMASFSFFVFFIPVLVKRMNVWTFIAGGLSSMILIGGMIYLFQHFNLFTTPKQARVSLIVVLTLFTLINVFYWQNWIPPVPLSLKDGGIYHHVSRESDTDRYTLRFEKPRWYQFFKDSDDPFRYAKGDSVACFTAIFAPTELTKTIYHHWQKYFPGQGKWITTDRLGYAITGYRDSGYRGYSRKRNVSAGDWRVDVETEEGILLGRIKFDIEEVEKPVALKTIYR